MIRSLRSDLLASISSYFDLYFTVQSIFIVSYTFDIITYVAAEVMRNVQAMLNPSMVVMMTIMFVVFFISIIISIFAHEVFYIILPK